MTREPQRDARRDAGFTLVELIAVLAILGLVTVLAFPSAERSRRAMSGRVVATEIASALKIARAEAVRTSRETRLVLDLAARRYSADGIAAPRAIPRDVSVAFEVPIASSGGERAAEIRFRPDGSSSGGSIRIASARTSAVVGVDWLTGRTRIDWGR